MVGFASNYSLANVTRTADITAKSLTISGTTASDKTYDATTSAVITAGTLSGLIDDETLGISATGTFSDSAVGTGKSVAVTYSLADGTNGGLASNYSLSDETSQRPSQHVRFRSLVCKSRPKLMMATRAQQSALLAA